MHHLSSPGTEPTEWVNRRAGVPRGAGFIEDQLGDIDRYLQKFAGTYNEKEERFWDVSRIIQRDKKEIPTLETVAKDFQSHIKYLNTTREDRPDGLSRVDRRRRGPDFSLPMPPTLNLAVFARAVEHTQKQVHRYGVDYAKKKWEPERDTPEIRQAWHKAALSPSKRELLILKLGSETLVFIDFEGKGLNWEPMIVKGKPRNTKNEDRRLNEQAKLLTIRGNQADSAALDELLRSTIGGPLVISPDGTRLIPMPEIASETVPNGDSSQNRDDDQPAPGTTVDTDSISVNQPSKVKGKGKDSRGRGNRRRKNTSSSSNQDTASTPAENQNADNPSVNEDEDDFWSNF